MLVMYYGADCRVELSQTSRVDSKRRFHEMGDKAPMAQKVVVSLVDDLDGTSSDDISTVNFGLDGANYEIDLNDRNAERLRGTLEGFIVAARRTGWRVKRSTASTGPATRPTASREQTKAVRDWANRNGHNVS